MAGKPFDSTTRFLLSRNPADWLRLIGVEPDGAVTQVESEVSSVSAETDAVFRVDSLVTWLFHLEIQASRDLELARRLFRYNALLDIRHDLPVRSAVLLLRPDADGPELSGRLERGCDPWPPHLILTYDVVRLWTLPVRVLLGGGLSTLPLAPLADLGRIRPEEVIRQMARRLDSEATPGETATYWTATHILLGLRYPSHIGAKLLRGVRDMRESTTYQAILEEGREAGENQGKLLEARNLVLAYGQKRLGPIDAASRARLDLITDLATLERIGDRALFAAKGWDEVWALEDGAG